MVLPDGCAAVPTVQSAPTPALDLDQREWFPPGPSIDAKARRMVNEEGPAMPVNIDDLLPPAKEIQRQAAINDAEKAERYAQKLAAAEAEKRALIESLGKASKPSEDEKIKLAADVIQRAVRNGLSEVQVYRFPSSLCTDRGRAISRQEAGWERTLTGIPGEIYQLWSDYLKPRGYRLLYQIVDFPGDLPGDVSIVIAWGD